ncbi:MAG TPA: endolytic transglycosylase MltG [Galbitalea sp.]|jgi:UPF0755 protein
MAEPTWADLFGEPDETPVRPAVPAPAVDSVDPLAALGFPAAAEPARVASPDAQPPAAPVQPVTGIPASRRAASRESAPRSRRERSRYAGDGRPPRRRLTWLWVLIVLLGLGVGGAVAVNAAFGTEIRHILGQDPSDDYKGSGNGTPATVTIVSGQIGSDIAKSLASAGVTKTSTAFYNLLLKQTTQPNFEPGTYKLQKQMSAKAALAQLLDPKNRVVSNVVIPEGQTLPQVLARLSKGTGVPLADLTAAAKNPSAFGVPKSAPSLEGFLFPATYQFDPGTPAKTILQRMVTRMNQSLKSHGVSAANELKVLTLASIIQKEGGSTKDFYKVSTVFHNRLDQGIHLQSDATVSYGAGSKKILTTAAQRADAANRYNTYVHAGLPVGPIAAPGDAAIDAALHPVKGSWLYFVLVNGQTGQTVFSDTLAEHNVAVKQWQAWLRAHPGYGE